MQLFSICEKRMYLRGSTISELFFFFVYCVYRRVFVVQKVSLMMISEL